MKKYLNEQTGYINLSQVDIRHKGTSKTFKIAQRVMEPVGYHILHAIILAIHVPHMVTISYNIGLLQEDISQICERKHCVLELHFTTMTGNVSKETVNDSTME